MNIGKVENIAKRRGIIYPSSEIYGGLSGFYDYGPIGVRIKRNVQDSWREFFVKSENNIHEIETSIVMPEKVWEASGHLKDFVDPITQCNKCKSNYRADDLILEKTGENVEGLTPKGVGIHSILINRRKLPYKLTSEAKPDFKIKSFRELPKILRKLED